MGVQEDNRTRLFEVAEQQSGFFTAAQALKAGYSYAAQSYHFKAGNWLRDRWGIYRLNHYPHTPGEELVRLMLWSRGRSGETRAVVSHESALQTYELSDVLPGATHLSVPRNFRKKPPVGVVLHRADLPKDDVRERDGYKITTPLRTLLDVAASSLSPEHLRAAAREALEKGLVRSRALEQAVRAAPSDVRERFEYVGMA
jgi:predicted transcriptional regulator of viral defense system